MMFLRLIYQSFLRQRRRKLLAGISIALGVTVATAMIAVATDVGDKINRELRSYGANIIVRPQADSLDVRIGGINLKPTSEGAFLEESQLPGIKGMFWGNNILAFAPFLSTSAEVRSAEGPKRQIEIVGTYFEQKLRYGKEEFATGVRKLSPWWKVHGDWPKDDSTDVLVGDALAGQLSVRPGDRVLLAGRELRVSGVLSTGNREDQQIIAPLSLVQSIAGKPGALQTVHVGALTKPEDELARRDPKTMNPETFDRWYCSPYARSIAYQLQETIPNSHADLVLQVSNSEGTVLSRIKGLMLLVTIAALLASALSVSAAMATAIMERRTEVGLMKALGAGDSSVAALFFAESALLALLGGSAGFAAGALLARQIGLWIFNSHAAVTPVLFPVVLAMAMVVAFLGSAGAIRKAMRYEPVMALRGDA